MDNSKLSIPLYVLFFSINQLSPINVKAAENDEKNSSSVSKFIELGGGYEYSDNIYKTTSNQKGSSTYLADLRLGYNRQVESNEIDLNYYALYKDQSDNDLEDTNYWIGRTKILQDVFTKNLVFNLEHFRQQYIIDERIANFDQNRDERDIIDFGLRWFLPYSGRSTFIFGIGHQEVFFHNSYNSDTSANLGEVTWQHSLNEITQLRISYFGSENKYDDFDLTYREHLVDAGIQRQYRLGNISFNLGQTWIQGTANDYQGPHFGLIIDMLLSRNLFEFNASRELTTASQQTGEDGELDFSGDPLFWYNRLSLSHNYQMIDERLVSKLRIYFNNKEGVIATDSGEPEDLDRYGVYGELIWSMTQKLSSSISANYYQTDIYRSGRKQSAEAEVYGRYDINNYLYFKLSTKFIKEGYVKSGPGYEEQRYTGKIAFRY